MPLEAVNVKKLLIGIMIGLIMSVPVTAFADEIQSMIGKVVEGTFPLKIDGQRAERDVLVIDGTSYIPVRAASELFGYDVLFNPEGEVVLQKKGASARQVNPQLKELNAEIKETSRKIEELYGEKHGLQELYDWLQKSAKLENTTVEELEKGRVLPITTKQYQEGVQRIDSELNTLQQQLAELEQQKAELEAQQ